ncbi:MAG TPA: response regulator transcription factor [Anaerolineae bacterium]
MEHVDQILIVDDEKNIRTVIEEALAAEGYKTRACTTAEEALQACEQTEFDLALLDLKLPGKMDGMDLLAEIHRHWPRTVIIMLTAYASLDSSIAALRNGAYDYLVKPASLSQIVASVSRGLAKKRVEAQRYETIARLEETLRMLKQENLAQPAAEIPERFVQISSLTIDRQKRLAVLDHEPLSLTATEFDLLDYLVRHCDRIVTASELVKTIQGYDLVEADARPIVRVHIQRLRQKLGDDPDHPRYILNIRGRGYRFAG